jgi:acyl-CoA thioesterase FadM
MPIFVETYWATVAPADCDHLGHMNVQHYFAAVSDGMFAIMVRLGLCPEEIRRRQISFAVVRAETDFHRELRPGDVIALESIVLTLGEKSATSSSERCGNWRYRNEHSVQSVCSSISKRVRRLRFPTTFGQPPHN